MPRSVRRFAAGLAVAVGLSLVPGAASAETPNFARQMFRETNQARARHHLARLDRAHRLTDEATRHARAMARRRTLFHSSGPRRYGVRCWTWGENVGWTDGNVQDLHRAFMRSASHRANVLNRRFRRVAVGSARTDRGRLYVALFFCT
jgi:uncharacterized protein YkwD